MNATYWSGLLKPSVRQLVRRVNHAQQKELTALLTARVERQRADDLWRLRCERWPE